jgi:hypothetical protein
MRHLEYVKDIRNAYKFLVVKLERKIPLGRSTRRWWGNIKMDFGGIG